jgi:hypothetical protein
LICHKCGTFAAASAHLQVASSTVARSRGSWARA